MDPDLPVRKGQAKQFHRKSRTGCQRCRTRRVKVREESLPHHNNLLASTLHLNYRIDKHVRGSVMKPNPLAVIVSGPVLPASTIVSVKGAANGASQTDV